MANEIKLPTAGESLTSALHRLAHKKMVLLIITASLLKNAHPGYLLANALIGTIAIIVADIHNNKKEKGGVSGDLSNS